MRRLLGFVAAFVLLVAGIESLRVLVAWWQAGHPVPDMEVLLAFAVFAVALAAWWRHSVFACRAGRRHPPA